MAILSALSKLNTAQSFEDAFRVSDITSEKMQKAIKLWFELYFDDNNDCNTDSATRIPYVVVDGLYKACFGEYGLTIEDSTQKDKHMATVIENLEDIQAEAFQLATIGGEGFIKPIVYSDTFRFGFIPRNCYVVLARNATGDITSLGTCEVTISGQHYYTLLERRTVADGRLTIEYKLFKSSSASYIGERTDLEDLYEGLEETVVLDIDNIGLAHIKMPMVNCVDGSKDGVSIYAAAIEEINTLYWHERRTNNEYELTEPHMVVSVDVLERDENGKVDIPKYAMSLNEAPENVGVHTYNPTPNQEQLEARANQILRNIENIIGLRRGVLSHVESDDRTATEVQASSARYALLIANLQKAWEATINEVLAVCDTLGQIYLGWDTSKYSEPVLSWGNGVLYDEDKEYQRLFALVQGGYLKAEYLLEWMELHSMDEKQIAEIRQQFMPVSTGTFGGSLFPGEGEDAV